MEFQITEGRVFSLNEQQEVLSEATYSLVRDGIVDINHTYVNPALRGQGIAGELMEALASELRKQGLKATASCSYANVWLERHRAANADIIA
ncbi:MAG: GNAT family N-acetyltransferase [Eubacteriales bacterium]|jgi:predicted GNAT family acetyltransferase|nr:GNAT family N-acetyltransferase [Eubacteriales bacterium]